MITFDFSNSGIRSWLVQGMVTLPDHSTSASTSKTKGSIPFSSAARGGRTASVLLALMAGINTCSSAQTVELPHQSAVVCSVSQDPINLRNKALFESLDSVASLDAHVVPTPSRQSVTAAKKLVEALPSSIAKATVGIDGDGHVYFKMQQGEKFAYLTVEPSTMHLLVMSPGQKNVYLDDVKFRPKEFPSKILKTLEQELVG